MKKPFYFDYQATTPVDPEILDYYTLCQRGLIGNPSSNHLFGIEAMRQLESARKKIQKLLKSKNGKIYFTNSATTAINTALKSFLYTAPANKRKILVLRTDHSAVLETLRYLSLNEFEITPIDVDEKGGIKMDEFKKQLTSDVLLVCVNHANNEIGTIQPLEEIGRHCKANNVLFFVDGAQALGKIDINLDKCNVDYYVASSHKIYGPRGVAMLVVSNQGNQYLVTYNHGGGQEGNIFCGTENVPGVMAFVKAIEKSYRVKTGEKRRLTELKTLFSRYISKEVPDVRFNGDLQNKLAGNINITIKGVPTQLLTQQLKNHIMFSAASACTEASGKDSHVLQAIGLNHEEILSTVRISIGRFSTKTETAEMARMLKETILSIRKKLLY